MDIGEGKSGKGNYIYFRTGKYDGMVNNVFVLKFLRVYIQHLNCWGVIYSWDSRFAFNLRFIEYRSFMKIVSIGLSLFGHHP